ncbi:hypothetical protein Taro_047793 [Colocasia esculenta]|uniref:Uncharacterized protein n=1 Tax=Colocasia esculenta TaxID=4460 RepID=A0A843WWY3_COLES|nr:hypothetical protein [Colocasia esculenta]
MLRTTPFAPFVDSNHRAIFKMTLIEEIAHTYKGASNFQVGEKTLTFTVEDVALILGLPSCGLRVPHYSSPIKLSKLHHRFGAKLTFDRKVWFLEHTRLRQPIDREAIPHLFRWGSVLDKKLSLSIDSLQGQQAMSKLLRFYKQWTWKSEASERQRALVEAFLAEEGYVDHK